MKTMKKLLLAAGILALLMLPVQAEDAVTEPVQEVEMTGETLTADYQTWYNVQWKFDSATGTLYIGGEGALLQGGPSFYPWYSYASQIKKVVVEEGITDLAYSSVRADTISYTEIHLPSTLTEMDAVLLHGYNLKTITVADGGMFYVQNGILFKDDGTDVTLVCQPGGLVLRTYTVPENVTKIGDYAFMSQTLTELTLPEGLVSIGSQAFYGCNVLTSLYIPAAVTDIHAEAFTYCNALETITVDPDNTVYTAQDGVLFTKDMKLLHTYPARKAGTAYTVPDGVEQIASTVMKHSRILEELTLSATVREVVQVMGSLSPLPFRAVYVDADNPYLCSKDGILYSKDMTALVHYPIGHTAAVYVMPDTLKTIVNDAIWAVSNLETVYWGSGVETVETRIYWGGGVKSMYFPGDVPVWMTNGCRNVRTQATMYYPAGNTTWTDGTMTYDGNTYTTAAYEAEEDVQWNTWENVLWRYDEETGTLHISGEGTMPDVEADLWPWYSLAESVQHVVFYGFEELLYDVFGCAYGEGEAYPNIVSVTLPSSLTYLNPIVTGYLPLQNYYAEEGGFYFTQDGILYSMQNGLKNLISYPSGRDEQQIVVPEGTQRIWQEAILQSEAEEIVLPESLLEILSLSIDSRVITTIHIPAGVEYVYEDAFVLCNALQSITVDTKNTEYSAVDGVLYTKDMTILVEYPEGRPDEIYAVPEGVEKINSSVMTTPQYMKRLELPASLINIGNVGIWMMNCSLEEINVDPDNTVYASGDGVLYDKDVTTMYVYPVGKQNTVFRIPDTVSVLYTSSMNFNRYLTDLYMNNVETVGMFALSEIPELRNVYFSGAVPAYLNTAFSEYGTTITLRYLQSAEGWSSPTMTVDGVTYNTAVYSIAGDITGDGTTDQNDLSLLTQYFSGYPTEIDESAVDLDGNGKLTRKDVMILARYLAGWDGYDQYFS